jgi:hypothetical protein
LAQGHARARRDSAWLVSPGSRSLQGWAVVRGVSDHADPDDDHQAVAAWHAVSVLHCMLPYLTALG